MLTDKTPSLKHLTKYQQRSYHTALLLPLTSSKCIVNGHDRNLQTKAPKGSFVLAVIIYSDSTVTKSNGVDHSCKHSLRAAPCKHSWHNTNNQLAAMQYGHAYTIRNTYGLLLRVPAMMSPSVLYITNALVC